MAALPYIQLYVADYLADTMHLTTEEHGAYLLIIMNYWQTGSPVKPSRLASIARMRTDKWAEVEVTIKEFFTIDVDGNWYHERIEDDLSKVLSKSVKASRAGKKSAQKRALQAIDNKRESNERSTDVAKTLQRKGNHTDTDTDTDTDKTILEKYDFTKWPTKPDQEIFTDWLAVRKTKKASVSKTVINRIGVELSKAAEFGFSVNDCLSEMVTRNWQGFKAEWMNPSDNRVGAQEKRRPQKELMP